MGLWSWMTGASSGSGPPNGLRFRWGISTNTSQSMATDGILSIIYSCCKTLSDNMARMPIQIKHQTDKGLADFKEHYLWDIFMFAPNGYQNPQLFWSTIEYHRNYYGNGFAIINRDSNGRAKSFNIIHPSLIVDARIIGEKLYYYYMIGVVSGTEPIKREVSGSSVDIISSDDIIHVRALSEDGIFGLSPVYVLQRNISILDNVEDTVDNFYKNKATASMALSSEVGDSRNYKVLKQAQEDFADDYIGPKNAGKVITLPPNTKLTSIASNYGDMQMIETMKFERTDIAGAFSIPTYMLGDTKGDDAENSSLVFRNYTISPIVKAYESEFQLKLLTSRERTKGVEIKYDLDALIEADLISKTGAIAEQVKSGLMSPNEGAVKMGNSKIEGKWGDYHYVQAQYIPLEEYGDYDVFGTEKEADVVKKDDDSLNKKNLKNKKDEIKRKGS